MKKFSSFSFLSFLIVFLSVLSLSGCSRMSTPNFQQMTLPRTLNYYLVCPEKYCNVTPNAVSPVYPVSAEDLFNIFNQLISIEPRVNFVYSIPEQGEFQLVYKSWLLGIPNDITVQFIALSEDTSTLAIYSKSRYGFYDFGMNKRRIEQWMQKLREMVAAR